MSYLQRTQRRDLILTSTMDLALAEGLTALTARRVAQAANISTGQVHHHFDSISHLKAEVFLKLMQRLSELESATAPEDSIHHLLIELGAENIVNTHAYLALWNEAEVLMVQDAQLKRAYIETMQDWQLSVKQIIDTGISTGQFVLNHSRQSGDVAWRLIAYVCGLEGMHQLNLFTQNNDDFKTQTLIMITAELCRHTTA